MLFEDVALNFLIKVQKLYYFLLLLSLSVTYG